MTEAGLAGIDSHYWITPALTLARTKRGVNKMLAQQVNLAYDALH